MPTYEYTCEACGNNWEAEQRISEPKLTDCPKCAEPKAKRLISGGNFMLKGGGWYADGYGNKKSSSSDKPAEGKPAESKSGDSSSSAAPSTAPAASTPAASTPAPSSSSKSE